jgi:hypothetical protein
MDWKFSTWFSNRGQLLQFLVGLCGFILACLVAWPTLQANNILNPGSILYFVVALFVIIASVRLLPLSKTTALEPDEIANCRGYVHKIQLHKGERWDEPGGQVRTHLTLRNVVEQPALGVEVVADGLTPHPQVKEIARDTFFVPASGTANSRYLSLCFFDNTRIDLLVIRLDHANPHAQTADFSICIASAFPGIA